MSDEKAPRNSHLLNPVNRSGFPFQLAVERAIRDAEREHQWSVFAHEYAWESPEGGSGFLDLLLRCGIGYLLCECKRSSAPWVFLIPEEDANSTAIVRCVASSILQDGIRRGVVHDFYASPGSYEAEFCVLGGDKRGELLEHTARGLVEAQESIAASWDEAAVQRLRSGEGGSVFLYLPLIITSAQLHVCRFDPSETSLETGKIPDTSTFEEVPWIRFKKTLTTSDYSIDPESLDQTSSGERTVWVVRASELVAFLKEMHEMRNRYGVSAAQILGYR